MMIGFSEFSLSRGHYICGMKVSKVMVRKGTRLAEACSLSECCLLICFVVVCVIDTDGTVSETTQSSSVGS